MAEINVSHGFKEGEYFINCNNSDFLVYSKFINCNACMNACIVSYYSKFIVERDLLIFFVQQLEL